MRCSADSDRSEPRGAQAPTPRPTDHPTFPTTDTRIIPSMCGGDQAPASTVSQEAEKNDPLAVEARGSRIACFATRSGGVFPPSKRQRWAGADLPSPNECRYTRSILLPLAHRPFMDHDAMERSRAPRRRTVVRLSLHHWPRPLSWCSQCQSSSHTPGFGCKGHAFSCSPPPWLCPQTAFNAVGDPTFRRKTSWAGPDQEEERPSRRRPSADRESIQTGYAQRPKPRGHTRGVTLPRVGSLGEATVWLRRRSCRACPGAA